MFTSLWYYEQNCLLSFSFSQCVCMCVCTHAHICPFKWRSLCVCVHAETRGQHQVFCSLDLMLSPHFSVRLAASKTPKDLRVSTPISAAGPGERRTYLALYMDVEIQIQILVFHNRRSYPSFQPFSYHPPLNTGSHCVAIVGLEFSV